MKLMSYTDEQILEFYSEALSHLKDILREDLMVTISDKTHFLYYHPGNEMKFPSGENPIGQLLPSTGAFADTIETGKCYFGIADKQRYGFPFLSITFPITNGNGDRIGCLALGKTLRKKIELQRYHKV